MDIVRAARQITEFVQDLDETAFRSDAKTYFAVQHQLMIIGEATKRLSSEFTTSHADVPWPLMARMRDRLIHAYHDIDLEVVWEVATRRIPELLRQVQSVAPTEGP